MHQTKNKSNKHKIAKDRLPIPQIYGSHSIRKYNSSCIKKFYSFLSYAKNMFFTTLQKSENHALNLFWDRYNQNIEEKIGNIKSLWTF